MIFLASLTAVSIMALVLVFWVLRGGNQGTGTGSWLHAVDVASFQNLLSAADDRFLQRELTVKNYRRVRRARLRAIQEYLVWIAQDCATLVAVLRSNYSQRSSELPREAQALVAGAVRLRITALGFWLLLWIEYVSPEFEVRPSQMIRKYEDLRTVTENHLRMRSSTAVATHQGMA